MTKGVTMSQPATEKQMTYIYSLMEKKIGDDKQKIDIHQQIKRKPLSKVGAGKTIKKLLEMPDLDELIPKLGDMNDGVYLIGERVFKVYHTAPRFGSKLKIKQYDPRMKKFYNVGILMAKQVREEAVPMTIEQMREFGKDQKVCLICSARLTDPESQAYGIGPTCRKRLGLNTEAF